MAILKTYNNKEYNGMVGNDIPARIFCHKCGTLLGSSKYEPEEKSLCNICAGVPEKTFAQICAEMTALF